MRNKKGFTIIEIVAIIGIITLITSILIPSVIIEQNKIKEKAYLTKKQLIEKTAKMYVEDNITIITKEIDLELSNGTCNKNEILENKSGCTCEKGECKYIFTLKVEDLIDLDLYKSEKKNETDLCHVNDPRNNGTCLDEHEMIFNIDNKIVKLINSENINNSSLNVKLNLIQTNHGPNNIEVKIEVTGENSNDINKYFYSIENNTYVESTKNTFDFTELAPGTSYIIKAYVENKDGVESEIAQKTFMTTGTSFDFIIPEYQKIKLINVPKGFTVKYSIGNQAAEYVYASGKDITNNLTISAEENTSYTFILINSIGKIVSEKKIYIYNYDGESQEMSLSINDTSITKIIGTAKTNNGSARATLNGSTLTLNAQNGEFYDEYHDQQCYGSCSNSNLSLIDGMCKQNDYTVSTTYVWERSCKDGSLTDHYTTPGSNNNAECNDGFTRDLTNDWRDPINIDRTSCNSENDTYIETETAYGICEWDEEYNEEPEIDYCEYYDTYYYQYTIGFEFE